MNEAEFNSVKIKCEVRTVGADINKRKRIDLVIEGDTFIIGIENKIGAELDNPLEDYLRHLQNLAKTRNITTVLPIVLSVNKLKKEQENECMRLGFVRVLYGDFIDELQKNLGTVLPQADHRAITYLLDFITSIDHQKKGTSMNNTLLKFFGENQQATIKFYRNIEKLKRELHEKVTRVLKGVKVPDIFTPPKLYSSFEPNEEIMDCVFCDFKTKKNSTWAFETGLYLNKGWLVYAFPREDGPAAELDAWLKGSGIDFIRKDGSNWIYAEFPYEASEENAIIKYQEFLNKISDKLRKK